MEKKDSLAEVDPDGAPARFEKLLLASLEKEGIEKASLRKYSALITRLNKTGLVIEKVWVLGQPVPDIFNIVGRLPLDKSGSFGGIFGVPGLSRSKVFPRGIINPENFDLHLKFDVRQF